MLIQFQEGVDLVLVGVGVEVVVGDAVLGLAGAVATERVSTEFLMQEVIMEYLMGIHIMERPMGAHMLQK